jgi:uncharacterized protein (DUF983 family)
LTVIPELKKRPLGRFFYGKQLSLFTAFRRVFAAPFCHKAPMNDLSPSSPAGAVSPFAAGLRCRCPRCGKGRMFAGFLSLRPECEVCGLDYSFIDSGDGPAVFVILIAGFLVVGAALIVEVKYQPPFWVHAALWLPLILLVTLAPLRPMKALMIALQYHHKAAEGQLVKRDQA